MTTLMLRKCIFPPSSSSRCGLWRNRRPVADSRSSVSCQYKYSYYSSTTRQTLQAGDLDPICELAASNLRFGPGATREVGQDCAQHFHAKRVVIFCDPNVASNNDSSSNSLDTVKESLQENGVKYTLYPPCLNEHESDSDSDDDDDDIPPSQRPSIRFEPNDVSFRQAADFLTRQVVCQGGGYDAVIALGGGSTMDTAKAANLYACHKPDDDFYDYVNPPLGKGLPPPGPLKPLIAIPTTAGTGSETTGVAIFDDTPTNCKTGIAHRFLKPTLGIVDPENTESLPPAVAAYSGLDVLCHAVESYTALPFNQRPKPSSPLLRPAYQGSNPISDVWSLFALETCATYIHDAVLSGCPVAREKMLLASSAAGLGFGNAGVHLCHGMSYPISSQNTSYTPPYAGYKHMDHPLIPHGLSVICNAPAVFTWTGPSCPERHATCARILQKARCARQHLDPTTSTASLSMDQWKDNGSDDRAGAWLADEIRWLCSQLVLTDDTTGESSSVPTGLKSFGCYTADDIPALVQGTIQQHRVTKIAPRQPVNQATLEHLFEQVMQE